MKADIAETRIRREQLKVTIEQGEASKERGETASAGEPPPPTAEAPN